MNIRKIGGVNMLYCQSCDYLKRNESKSSNECKCVCEFTGFAFHKNIEDYDIEIHPCYNYQISKIAVQPKRIVANINKKFRIS